MNNKIIWYHYTSDVLWYINDSQQFMSKLGDQLLQLVDLVGLLNFR